MRPAARARHRVDALDPLRAHAEQPVIGDRDQLVLARTGADGAGDVDIGGVDHGAGHFQKLDLVGGFHLAGIEHRLLAVDHLDALLLQRAQHRQFHEIDADRLLVDAEFDQRLLDLLGEVALHVELQRQAALHGRNRGGDVVGDPRRGDAFGRRRRVPQQWRALHRTQRIAHELVARPFADMGAGDVADVVEIEGDHAAEPGVADRFLGARQTLLVQAIVVDPLLPILGHRAPGRGRLRSVVFHGVVLAVRRSGTRQLAGTRRLGKSCGRSFGWQSIIFGA